MLLSSFVLALQISVTIDSSGLEMKARAGSDTTRAARRIEVTDEHLRTAFRDNVARDLLMRARETRMQQDSLLQSYDSKAYQRISVGMSLRETARSRLAFRSENAAHIRWHHESGAWVDVLGARMAIPFSGEAERAASEAASDMISVPYYPGKEQLWIGGELARAEVDESQLVHPIAEGSEAYYTFQSGDSVLMVLPNGQRIVLRELKIRARTPRWNLIVGSFWFETERANLVRAVYRLSEVMDIQAVANQEDPGSMDDIPFWVRPLISPMRADITAISVEYGLYNQRFWLPRLKGAEGYARVSFMRIPVKIEQRFQYESVNALESLPPVFSEPRLTASALRDSLYETGLDSASVRDAVRQFRTERDSIAKAAREQECAEGDYYTENLMRIQNVLPMAVRFPCDPKKLIDSPELSASVYDSGEDLFGVNERSELMKALTMGLQPGWGPRPPVFDWGLAHTRFNRVEGLSTGGVLRSTFGNGYTGELGVRGSIADRQLNGHITGARTNGRQEVRATVFRRLAVSSDFGDPLSLGASLGSLLYARDEGFYHRTWGGEIAGSRPMRGGFEWRVFAEEHRNAEVDNTWSLFGGSNDDRFIANVVADRGWYYGAGARWRGSRGLDPKGWRATGDVRLEGATGESDYGRAFLETTVSKGLGPIAASLTTAAGTSVGELPSQRHFFLGGLHSVRGQTAGTGVGDAFWLGRLEVGKNHAGIRPLIFGDIGWAGSRDQWSEAGRPLSGVGIGASFLDGMIRTDLSRGVSPRWQTRFDLYLEARF